MKIGLSDEVHKRSIDMIEAIDRLTAAVEANTAAICEQNAQRDFEQNGPRA